MQRFRILFDDYMDVIVKGSNKKSGRYYFHDSWNVGRVMVLGKVPVCL